jgi:Fe-S cluster assembly protein SufD
MTINILPIRTTAEASLIERFPALRATLPGNSHVLALRDRAFDRFLAIGLPHRRIEAWKYTDLRGFLRESAPLAVRPSPEEARSALANGTAFNAIERTELRFVNGHMIEMDALPAGLSAVSLADALASGHEALTKLGAIEVAQDDLALSLNAAFMTDGVVVVVDPGAQIALPLSLRLCTTGPNAVATAFRAIIIVGSGARLSLLETHESEGGAHQPNTAVELVLRQNAVVDHVRLGANGAETITLSTLTADLSADSHLTTLNVTASGALARHQVFARFSGEGVTFVANGTTMVKDRQHVDNTLVVDHAAPHGTSRELFRSVVDGEATAVFQGKIAVRQIAQKTDGRMASNALLLSEGAIMNNKPELEIFADDVACAHGATCGALDDDLLFYLMSRGIPRREAEALMIASFLGEAVAIVEHANVRSVLDGYIASWLATRS